MSRFCIKCGAANEEHADFCARCGQPMTQMEQLHQQREPMGQQFQQREQMKQKVQQAVYQNATDTQPQLGMKWYYFQVKVNLWLCMVFFAIAGFMLVTGVMQHSINGENSRYLYERYPSLQSVEILFGILYILLAISSYWVRKNLVEFKANAPKMFCLFMFVPAIIEVCYVWFTGAVIDSSSAAITGVVLGEIVTSVIPAGVVLCLNYIYFKKRKHLFIN